VRRLVATLVILAIGIPLMLWAINNALMSLSRYGVKVRPIAVELDAGIVAGAVLLMVLLAVAAVTVVALVRSRRLLGVIPLSELRRHALVFGPTGSGKTTIALRAVKLAVDRGVSVVVIDWKGEYSQRIRGATIVRKIRNVWDVPGESAREKALVAVELIQEMGRDVIDITPPSSLLLLKVLVEEYGRGVPTTEKIVKVLERALKEGRYAESNMYLALIRRLFVLLVDEERRGESVDGSSRVVVYDLGGLPSIYLKTLYANYVLTTPYRRATRAGMDDRLRTLVIAEEAQNYVRPRRLDELPSMGERIVNELRGYGVGVVLVCPDPEQLPRHMSRDVAAVISTATHNLPRDIAEMAIDPRTGKARRGVIVFYNGRLYAVRRPRPLKIIGVPTEARVERRTVTEVVAAAEPQVEESLRAEESGEAALSLRLEDEEESEEAAEAPPESRGPW
jgi:RecA/RadA recombinase